MYSFLKTLRQALHHALYYALHLMRLPHMQPHAILNPALLSQCQAQLQPEQILQTSSTCQILTRRPLSSRRLQNGNQMRLCRPAWSSALDLEEFLSRPCPLWQNLTATGGSLHSCCCCYAANLARHVQLTLACPLHCMQGIEMRVCYMCSSSCLSDRLVHQLCVITPD